MATRSYTDAVNEALERLQGVGYEFGPSFVNHAPMAAEALAYLGYPDIVPTWLDRNLRSHRYYEPPAARARLAGDNRAEWEAALGDFSRVADWVAMFERELAEEPWTDVISRWWPRLLPGMAGVLGHGVIRTAHAVRALVQAEGLDDELQLAELAHGLGYWSARARVGNKRASGGAPPGGETGQDWERVAASQALDELIAENAAAYASTPQGFPIPLIHTITAPAAVRLICDYLPDDQCRPSYHAARLLSDGLRANFGGRPRVRDGDQPAEPQEPGDVIAAAVELGDEHAIKLAEVAIRQHALTGDESCLSASALATRLISRYPVLALFGQAIPGQDQLQIWWLNMNVSSSTMLAEVTVDVAAVLAVGAALAPLAGRLRQPRVMAEIVAGIALGPSVLGLLPGHLTSRLFPLALRSDLSSIAEVGVLLFMFLIGWDINPGQVRKERSVIFAISMSSIALPFGLGVALAALLYRYHSLVGGRPVNRLAFVLFFGTAIAITAFPVLARIIREHRLEQTHPGRVALASAAVGDALAWCMLAFVSAVTVSAGPIQLARTLGFSILYIACLALLVRPALLAFLARMGRGDGTSQSVLAVIVSGVFIAGYVTQQIGLDAIFGAFSFGLIMPRDSVKLLSRIREPVERTAALLLPVYFVTTGLSVDIAHLGGYWQLAAIIAVACLGKILGAVGAARLSAMSWRDSAAVGLLMNTRGLTELIILNIGVSLRVLDTQVFSMMVVMALVTTGMAGPLVPRLVGINPDRGLTADDPLMTASPVVSGP